eukprot:jgi/Mesvir1/26445/Mv16125-RA.1
MPKMIPGSSMVRAFLVILALLGQSSARLLNYPGESIYHTAGRGLRAFTYGNEPYQDDQGAFDSSANEVEQSNRRQAQEMEDVFVDEGFDTPSPWQGDDRGGNSGSSCSSKKDCEPGRLCVDGDCLCPIIPGLTESMKRGCHIDPKVWKSKGGRKWCILPVSDFDTELEYKDTYVLDGARSHPTMDLPHLADWSTCAVVGSSGNLKKKNLGPEIDAHTAVIRFNDAPTKGYEEYVGRKTTMRVQNVEYCGFSERKGEILVHYTLPKKDKCKKAMELAPHFLEYEMGYFKQSKEEKPAGMPRSDPSGGEQKLSGGFMGIAMAMHLCGKIDIYGFSESEIHYYDKNMEVGQAHDFKERHNWNYEHACIRQLSHGSMARVKVHI